MKIKKVLPKLVNYSLPITFILSSVPLNAGDTFDITIDAPTGSTNQKLKKINIYL